MALTKIPSRTVLADGQFIQVEGPDEILSGFQYDAQQRALYAKESQVVFPSHHGLTHIAEDPVPQASCDSQGLMSPDDKCKLDSLLQTRIGVLGFMGAGFPDDGGWMCFPGDAPVLLPDSTTSRIDALTVNTEVVSHSGTPRRVLRTFERDYEGDLIELWMSGHRSGRFACTPEHPILAVRNTNGLSPIAVAYGNLDGTFAATTPTWVEAGSINPGDYIVRRLASTAVADRTTLEVADYASDVELDSGMVFSIESCRASLGSNKSTCTVATFIDTAAPIPAEIVVGAEFLRLCGYYLAEGHIDGRPGRPKEIVFSIHTAEAFGELGADITACCEAVFGIRPVIKPSPCGGACHQICLNSALAARFMAGLLPGNSRTKAIPRWLMELPADKQKWLLLAFLEGDGMLKISRKTKTIECCLCNETLIEQLCALFERQGADAVISTNRRYLKATGRWYDGYKLSVQAAAAEWLWTQLGGQELHKPSHMPARLDFSMRAGGYTLRRVNTVTRRRHAGPVYNIEVETDNSYVVNGSAVHNCGDVILAAGTEFISLERVGNVVRFTVDSPIPLACNCESCIQLFWVQDETDISAIRPPTCGGKLPGTNLYGEIKIYLFPESTIVDPANASASLNNKGRYPALIFKRYDDSISPGTAEYELILKRNANNQAVTEVGEAFTPGPAGIPEKVWFMGLDDDGDLIRFDLDPVTTPGVLGGLLFKGHLITKQMAVITDYTATVLTNNQYRCRLWDVINARAIGDVFTATNVWRYLNPENTPTTIGAPQILTLDISSDVLPLGTLVDLWKFQIGEIGGVPIYRHFFKSPPVGNMANVWTTVAGVEFGDTVQARGETEDDDGNSGKTGSYDASGINDFEPTIWGLTGFDVPLMVYGDVEADGTAGAALNTQHRALINTDLPGLIVVADSGTEPFSQRPVMLWNRIALDNSMLIRAEIGRPDDNSFTPYDVLLHAPIDSYANVYMKVVGAGTVNGVNYVRVKGASFHDLPQRGTIRVISTDSGQRNHVFNFHNKLMFPAADDDSIALMASADDNRTFAGATNDIVELLHREYSAPCVRLHFVNDPDGTVRLQFKVGILGMDTEYENDLSDDLDDYVRGMRAGYAVSAEYSQDSAWTGTGTQPSGSVDGFFVYDGGQASDDNEYWNVLEIMLRQGQVWIWWNGLLIPPSTSLSNALPTPVEVITPYFPLTTNRTYGKFGMRLWPGSKIRRVLLRTQPRTFSEFTYGQLELT